MGLFEELHELDTPDALARLLKEAAGSCYGTPGRVYLERLARADRAGLTSGLSKRRNSFLAEHVPPGTFGQVSSVAARFGLIGAAGELAISMGILLWPEGEADRAAGVCFRAWLNRRGGADAYEIETGIAQVRHFLELHGESRFTSLPRASMMHGRPTFRRVGYCKLDEDGQPEFYVLPEVWRSEICTGFDPQTLAPEMAARGLLLPSKNGRLTRKERVGGKVTVWVYRVTAALFDDPGEPEDVDIDGDAGDTSRKPQEVRHFHA